MVGDEQVGLIMDQAGQEEVCMTVGGWIEVVAAEVLSTEIEEMLAPLGDLIC
jgi:hypothetical protein